MRSRVLPQVDILSEASAVAAVHLQSFELWEATTGRLVAGEIGVVVGECDYCVLTVPQSVDPTPSIDSIPPGMASHPAWHPIACECAPLAGLLRWMRCRFAVRLRPSTAAQRQRMVAVAL